MGQDCRKSARSLQENDYRALFERMSEGFALWEIVFDEKGQPSNYRLLAQNPAFKRVTGLDCEDAVGRLITEVISVQAPPYLDVFARVASTGEPADFEHYNPRSDRYFYVIAYSPKRGQVATLITETTQRRRAEEELKRREKFFRLLIEHAVDVVYRFELKPHKRFAYISPAVAKMLGYSPEDFYKKPMLFMYLINPEDRNIVKSALHCNMEAPGTLTIRLTRKDGSTIWVEQNITPIINEGGRVVAFEAIARDVTERKEMEETLKYLSLHDVLTGLYNRAFFEEEMKRLHGGRDYPITILCTDIDSLKRVNDALGHQQGDELLKAYARVLKSTFRKTDIIARVGGDEFAVILPRTDGAAADQFCERLQQAIAQHNASGTNLILSVSSGAATAQDASCTLQELFNQADKMMYRNKALKSLASRISSSYLFL